MSVKNLGADLCVGFDITEGFIDQARQLADTEPLDCEFVCTDVYSISTQYNRTFNLVYITIGVLGWTPDIQQFIEIVARRLKPNGWLLMYGYTQS